MQGLELPDDRPASQLVESDAGELATALIDLFEKLASEGFKDEQIEESFRVRGRQAGRLKLLQLPGCLL